MRSLVFAVAAMLAGPAAAVDITSRATIFEGPYDGRVVRVIDGDTVVVRVAVWPGMAAETSVRIRGIDAPEMRRPDCAAERDWAERATTHVEAHYPEGAAVRLTEVSFGSFAGRVVAGLARRDGEGWTSLGDELIDAGLAVAWEPGQDRPDWCAKAEAGAAP